jgi:hypothetical protein
MRKVRTVLTALVLISSSLGSALGAQTPAADPTARLREVLPPDVAERVIAKIAEARSRELPAQALENRALKFAARGVPPIDIERAINEHVQRQMQARSALETGRPARPSRDEVEAGAEAMRMGVDGAAVSALAKSAPSGRSLAVPLYVIGSLVDRGLPSDAAMQRVLERLQNRATDAEIERLPIEHTTVRVERPGHPTSRPGGPGARQGPPLVRPGVVPPNGGRPNQPTTQPPPTTGTGGTRPPG